MLERQNSRIMSVKAMMNDFARRGDNLCAAIVGTIFRDDLFPSDPTFPLQEVVRQRLEEGHPVAGSQWSKSHGDDAPSSPATATLGSR